MASLHWVLFAACVVAAAAFGFSLENANFHRANRHAIFKERSIGGPILQIVGGAEITPYSWPFLVQLNAEGNKDEPQVSCGGAIIHPSYVLTAAHCYYGISSTSDERVIAGEHNIRQKDAVEQKRKVVQVIMHPQYNDDTIENDIALLKVDQPFDLSVTQVASIKLNTQADCPADQAICRVAGWGALKEGGPTPDVPQEVKVPVMSLQRCKAPDVYGPNKIFDTNICAGFDKGGKDSCQGDSGGPFICKCGSNGEWVHTGVVSWGTGCARAGKPGVYTRTSSFVTWINGVIANGGSGGGGGGGGGGGSDGGDGGGSDGGDGGGSDGGGGDGGGGDGGDGGGDGGNDDGNGGDDTTDDPMSVV